MSSLKILHVEDNEGLARLLQKRMIKEGFAVDWAKDGVDGLAMYEQAAYDVVIVDYNMPRKSGIEVMKTLLLTDNPPPIIFLTASGDEKLAVKAIQNGASDYVVKDIELGYLDLLPTVISNSLFKKRLAEDKRRAEIDLRETNEKLEERVRERTHELTVANARLEEEIAIRKKAEQENMRLAAGIAQAADVVVITDMAGKIQYVNPAFERSTGYSREEAIGLNPRALKSGKHDDEFYKRMWDTISSGHIWHGRLVNKRKDGSLYEEEMTISPVRDAGGMITNFVAVKHDITSSAALARARDYFVAVTSHELRTPLNGLELAKMLLNESLKEHPDSKPLARAMAVLSNSCASFERIVSTTEMFRDLTLTGQENKLSEASLGALLDESVKLAAGKLEKEKRLVEIKVDVSGLPGTNVLCDPQLAQRAINEIISNAVKYTPDGRSVSVSGKVADGFAIAEIEDEGSGIDSDKKEMVFEPLFSPSDPLRHTTSQYKYMGGGLGMGLTLARLIMERHGGMLDLRNSGKGTVAKFSFRLAKSERS
ncbi:MAG: response regulator [Nitrospinae bacterium]|nr:response regulator [Nitrospinota bacterium]